MDRPGRSGKGRRSKLGREPVDAPDEPGEPVVRVGPIVRWQRVGEALTSLAATTTLDSDARFDRFVRLVGGLVTPLSMLETLADDATAALTGEVDARRRFAASLSAAAVSIGIVTSGRSSGAPAHGGGTCCDPCDRRDDVATNRRSGLLAAAMDTTAEDLAEAEDLADAGIDADASIFDQSALTTLLTAAASVVVDPDASTGLTLDVALDTVVALVGDSGVMASVVSGHREHGAEGALASLAEAGRAGGLSWLAATDGDKQPAMRTMGGARPGGIVGLPAGLSEWPGGLPGGPMLPGDLGLPGLPGIPGDSPPVGEGVGDLIIKILERFTKPNVWTPDLIDHEYPWWQNPRLEYIDPWAIEAIRCFLAANAILRQLAEPPPRSSGTAVWNTGITSVSLSGQCAGATITIRGTGFGATQPAGTALLIPTLEGCRPVMPTLWSDTRIEAVLPTNVGSGPVGFGDATYIAAHDAWAAKMNDLERKLARLPCRPRSIRFVAPFKSCPPRSRINLINAGVPEIVAFTANNEIVHVLEHGRPLTLRWTVRNAATTTITRISSSGQLFGSSATLTGGAFVTSYAFGPVNHVTREQWQYRITVTGACGPPVSRIVRVITARKPALRVSRIQVTQSIQTPDHTVQLVTSKPTVVRAVIEHGLAGWGGGTVSNVTGRIRMWRNGWSHWIDAANNTKPMRPSPGASITVPAAPSMNETNDTLNFLIPPSWCSGNPSYEVEVRVTAYGALGPFAGFDERVVRRSVPVTYQDRRMVHLRWIRVNWNGAGAPSPEVCEDTLRAAVPMLPTPTAGVLPLAGQGVHNRSAAPDDTAREARRMLDHFDDLHNCSLWEALTEWLGSDCPVDDGTIWVLIPGDFQRGSAYAIPSNVCYTPPSDGPYAAHELAHCLGQQHVRLPATGDNAPVGGDAASASPWNGAMLTDVPFDPRGSFTTTGGAAATAPRALSLNGRGVADMMTYWGTPNNTWPMPARWDRLWAAIGA